MIKRTYLTICSLLFSCSFSLFAEPEFVHPGVMHTQESIDFVRAKIDAKQGPWTQAWRKMHHSRHLRKDREPSPNPHVERGPSNNPNIGSSDFTRDGDFAYTNALEWAISGDESRARKAAEILDAWSSTLETVGNHDARLLIGMSGLPYIIAAELLTHTWDGWPEESQAQFAKMLREIWYPIIKDFYPTANGNWDASMLQTMIAMGVYLDDRAIFDRAVDYYRNGEGNGAVDNYFMESGQCQESGRDQNHTQMGLEFLANTCETAWIQGVDLYGAHDNRLLKGFEYTAKYNLDHEVPYVPYKSFEGRYHYETISDKQRGKLRDMYERVFNHYSIRKGMEAPFTKRAALENRPESGGRGTLPWSTLMQTGLPR